jgi:hypothetical protein
MAQTLAQQAGNRLRKIVCQDLLSQNLSVILFAVAQTGPFFSGKTTVS